MKTAKRTFRLLPFATYLLLFLFSTAPAQSPEATTHFAQARAAELRNDWATAETEYQKALALHPRWAEALVNLGVIFNRQNKSAEAIKTFTRATQIKPRMLAAWLNLGVTHFRAAHYDQALAPLRRALKI